MSLLLVSKNSFMTKDVNHLSCNANEISYFIDINLLWWSVFCYVLKYHYVVIKKTKQKTAVSKQQETLPGALSFPVLQALSLENKFIFLLCFIQCAEFGFGQYIPVHP